MTSFEDRLTEIHPTSPTEWRSWLEQNHDDAEGVWLIYFRTSTGNRGLTWEDAVREALCFGWIDSKVKPIDDERYKQIFTQRKPKSVWSKVNKQHVAELIDAGLMTDAGLRAIDVAKENGAWTFLDPIDSLTVPPDLAAALAGSPTARTAYEQRSPSARKTILYQVYAAKREETRAKRVAAAIRELEGGD